VASVCGGRHGGGLPARTSFHGAGERAGDRGGTDGPCRRDRVRARTETGTGTGARNRSVRSPTGSGRCGRTRTRARTTCPNAGSSGNGRNRSERPTDVRWRENSSHSTALGSSVWAGLQYSEGGVARGPRKGGACFRPSFSPPLARPRGRIGNRSAPLPTASTQGDPTTMTTDPTTAIRAHEHLPHAGALGSRRLPRRPALRSSRSRSRSSGEVSDRPFKIED
jgi:hypothetical protein